MPLTELAAWSPAFFRRHEAVADEIREACDAHRAMAAFYALGESEEGRLLYGVVLGTGRRVVSLVAGAHADEPVGPETLRTFILEGLHRREQLGALFAQYTFVIVPHVNPDGEERNRAWTAQWPSLEAYLRHAFREPPGRDLEFGYPEMRVENKRVAEFLRRHAPYVLHVNLHGMGFSEGAMLLIERHWSFRTQALRDRFRAAASQAGLRMHDHNRKGEKGFFHIEPGFDTTPEGTAMRTFFRAQGDEETARQFHDSSMEYVRTLGGDPLCVVTELPLFMLPNEHPEPGHPAAYLAFKERLPEIKLCLEKGEDAAALIDPFHPRPLDVQTAVRLQLQAIDLALEAAAQRPQNVK